MKLGILSGAVAFTAVAAIAVAQTNHGGHEDGKAHAAQGQTGPAILTEPGQGAFAALSEAVAVLEADPETNWSRVDLRGLRDHLVDMDRLVTMTDVVEEPVEGGLRMTATGDTETLATLRRMVPAHAAQLSNDPRWTVEVIAGAENVELIVTSNDRAAVARIRGLGFFGLMASQDHHREHHLAMARGKDIHDP